MSANPCRRVDDGGIGPVWQPDDQAADLAAEELSGAGQGRRQLKAATYGADCGVFAELGLHCHDLGNGDLLAAQCQWGCRRDGGGGQCRSRPRGPSRNRQGPRRPAVGVSRRMPGASALIYRQGYCCNFRIRAPSAALAGDAGRGIHAERGPADRLRRSREREFLTQRIQAELARRPGPAFGATRFLVELEIRAELLQRAQERRGSPGQRVRQVHRRQSLLPGLDRHADRRLCPRPVPLALPVRPG